MGGTGGSWAVLDYQYVHRRNLANRYSFSDTFDPCEHLYYCTFLHSQRDSGDEDVRMYDPDRQLRQRG